MTVLSVNVGPEIRDHSRLIRAGERGRGERERVGEGRLKMVMRRASAGAGWRGERARERGGGVSERGSGREWGRGG